MRGALAAIGLFLSAAPAHAADAAHPAVIELFQSQGCSSCPPANAHVLALANRPDVLALSWQVTYWDYLGWRDSFGDQAFAARQYDYARGLGHDGVFTPQVVVNGRADGVGTRTARSRRAATRRPRQQWPIRHALGRSRQYRTGRGSGRRGACALRPADHPGGRASRREWRRHAAAHRNVVREVRVLGRWTGQTLAYPLPAASRAGFEGGHLGAGRRRRRYPGRSLAIARLAHPRPLCRVQAVLSPALPRVRHAPVLVRHVAFRARKARIVTAEFGLFGAAMRPVGVSRVIGLALVIAGVVARSR